MIKLKAMRRIICLSLFYSLLIIVWGYEYGIGDDVQIMPSILFMHDKNLYSTDFFIQNSGTDTINERSFFLYFLYPFSQTNGIGNFILHLICSLFLFEALLKIANLFLKNILLSWLVLIALTLPLFYHSLGLSELYSNGFGAGLASHALAAWAIYYWLQKKISITYILLTLSALFHPLSGFQVFLLITGVECIEFLRKNRSLQEIKNTGFGVFLFSITAGIFIYAIKSRFNDAAISDENLFTAFFSFRNAHHYLPHTFPKSDWIVLTPLFLCIPFIFFAKESKITIFSIFILTGCVVYSIGVEGFQSVQLASSQWFKATIWLEYFGLVALILLLQKLILSESKPKLTLWFFTGTCIVCLAWIVVVFPTMNGITKNNTYLLPFFDQNSAAMDISLKAKELTPIDALFIHPCSFSYLNFYGERSSYVDYKALTHKKSFLAEWAFRFEEVYQIDIATAPKSFEGCQLADANFKQMSPAFLTSLYTQKNITHVITFAECILPFQLLAENKEYKLYALSP